MQQILTVVVRFARLLEELKVPYFVSGSVASIAYGQVRTTLDIDIVARLKMEHAAPMASRLRMEFYVIPDAIREAIEQHASFNLVHLASAMKADIFVPPDDAYTEAQFSRIIPTRLGGDSWPLINLASPEDIVLAKLRRFDAGGRRTTRHWEDVLGVLAVQRDALHFSYLLEWAKALGIDDLLDRALDETRPDW